MFAEQCCSHRIVARDNGGPTIEPVSQKISLPGEYVTVTDTDAHGRRWRRRGSGPPMRVFVVRVERSSRIRYQFRRNHLASRVQPIHQLPKRLDAPALPAHSGSHAKPSSFNNAHSASKGFFRFGLTATRLSLNRPSDAGTTEPMSTSLSSCCT
jgi:hypothetical protein